MMTKGVPYKAKESSGDCCASRKCIDLSSASECAPSVTHCAVVRMFASLSPSDVRTNCLWADLPFHLVMSEQEGSGSDQNVGPFQTSYHDVSILDFSASQMVQHVFQLCINSGILLQKRELNKTHRQMANIYICLRKAHENRNILSLLWSMASIYKHGTALRLLS